MQVSDLFIRRPVFSVVVSLLLMVGGLAALMQLAVREYPQVDPPVVSINTTYKGAANEVIESRVTELIEGSVAGLEGIRQITSASQNERSSVTIEFWVGRDPDAAAADVRDRVARIMARLPEGVDLPVVRKVDSNAAAIMWVGVTSSTLDALELTEFLKRVYVDRLATVPGVATVYIGGERRYAMRIWVDRTALAARGLTVLDVESAIKKQNVELPGGLIASSKRELTVKADSRLARPEEFAQVVVSNKNGYLVRLGEVAKVEVGPEDDRFEFYKDGNIALGLGIVRQATANTLTVADGVRAELEKLKGALPPGTETHIMYDESQLHPRLDQRRAEDAPRGHRPRHPRHPGLPARLALDHRRHGRDPGLGHRLVHGGGVLRRLDQRPDPARDRARHRHRRRRRDRRDREHPSPHRARRAAAARLVRRRARDRLRGHRDDLHADGGVRAARLHDRQHRAPVPRVRDPARRRDLLLRRRRPHADADDVLEADGAGARADPPPDRAGLRGHDQRLSLDPVAGAQHPARHPGDRGRGLVCRRQPVPGDPEGVRADRGPRLRPDPGPGARGVEPRLHPRAAEGGRAGDRAAARARTDVEHAEHRGARLHPAVAGERRARSSSAWFPGTSAPSGSRTSSRRCSARCRTSPARAPSRSTPARSASAACSSRSSS